MDVKEAILDYIRRHGPSVPPAIASALKRDTVLVSAFLSELTRSGELRYSQLMVGRSRLYFTPGQEAQLQQYADHLSEKDRRSYQKLSEGEVLRDRDLDSLTRVSLRNIPDFAVPLEVTHNNRKELFWRFYQVSSARAEELIRDMLDLANTNELEATNGVGADKETGGEAGANVAGQPQAVPEDSTDEASDAPAAQPAEDSAAYEMPQEQDRSSQPQESADRQQGERQGSAASSGRERTGQRELSRTQTQDAKSAGPKSTGGAGMQSGDIDDEFAQQIRSSLEEQGIRIFSCEVVRKRSEVDLDISVPSPLGELRYFCKGRNKKSINEGDLASAFVTGQLRRLPIIFVTPGKLTKRAQEKLEQEMQSITVTHIE